MHNIIITMHLVHKLPGDFPFFNVYLTYIIPYIYCYYTQQQTLTHNVPLALFPCVVIVMHMYE